MSGNSFANCNEVEEHSQCPRNPTAVNRPWETPTRVRGFITSRLPAVLCKRKTLEATQIPTNKIHWPEHSAVTKIQQHYTHLPRWHWGRLVQTEGAEKQAATEQWQKSLVHKDERKHAWSRRVLQAHASVCTHDVKVQDERDSYTTSRSWSRAPAVSNVSFKLGGR